jgi:hypothetical protein
METRRVFCAVETEYMNIIQRNLKLCAGEDHQQFSSKSIMAESVKTHNFVWNVFRCCEHSWHSLYLLPWFLSTEYTERTELLPDVACPVF